MQDVGKNVNSDVFGHSKRSSEFLSRLCCPVEAFVVRAAVAFRTANVVGFLVVVVGIGNCTLLWYDVVFVLFVTALRDVAAEEERN